MSDRRKFLKSIAMGGIGISLPDPLKNNHNTITQDNFIESTSTSKPGKITLLQTTDVHCQIHPHDELFWENEQMVFRKTAGYTHLATLFKSYRKSNPNTFIVDTGDMFQGSMLSIKTRGGAFIDILNQLGYDLYLPGNWEVVYHKERMQELLGGLDAPKVCANMYHDMGNGQKGELIFPAYYTIVKEGVKIGFLGYTDHLVPIRQSPLYSKGIVYTKPEENLKYYVEVLKKQEQCDYIIILAHIGLSQQIYLANLPACEGVNYIFGGDTHERVRKPIQCTYAKVVEPGAFGSFVGKLELTVQDGKIIDEQYELLEVKPDRYKADKEMDHLISTLEQDYIQSINTIHGYSKVPLYRYFVVENTIDTMIIDALMWRAKTDIVLSNGFRFCPPRTADHTGMTPITEGFIVDMLPVDAPVRSGIVTGQQIKDWLEKELQNVFAKDASKRFGGWVVKMKGMSIEFKAHEDVNKRVQKIEVNGQPIDLSKEYSVTACEREGDPEDTLCRITHVKNPHNLDFTLHQLMRDYVHSFSPVNPVPHHNVVVLDAPQTLLSQVFGV
ncbi:MAG: 5'-nucleotidase C-terminal domain-containing protein, partial [Saprospiraceae bacterium]